jgi:hypothetical protein
MSKHTQWSAALRSARPFRSARTLSMVVGMVNAAVPLGSTNLPAPDLYDRRSAHGGAPAYWELTRRRQRLASAGRVS